MQERDHVALGEDKAGPENDSRRGRSHGALEGEERSSRHHERTDDGDQREEVSAEEQSSPLAVPSEEHEECCKAGALGSSDLAVCGGVHGKVGVIHLAQVLGVFMLVLVHVGRVNPFEGFHETN